MGGPLFCWLSPPLPTVPSGIGAPHFPAPDSTSLAFGPRSHVVHTPMTGADCALQSLPEGLGGSCLHSWHILDRRCSKCIVGSIPKGAVVERDCTVADKPHLWC